MFSRQLVLVLDVSDSMKETEPWLRGDNPNADPLSRLLLMKHELYRLFLEFDSDVALDLVSYSDHAKSWMGRLVPMNAHYRAKARGEIRDLDTGGFMNLIEATAVCFDMARGSLDAVDLKASAPDTLYVLTDGAPNNGARHLLDYVAERNRELHLRIHCVCLSNLESSITFMRDLAELSQGDYSNPLH